MKAWCQCHGENLEAHIREVVDRAPALSQEQEDLLVALLQPVRAEFRRRSLAG